MWDYQYLTVYINDSFKKCKLKIPKLDLACTREFLDPPYLESVAP